MYQESKIKRILFTTDLSENARQNFYYAASLSIGYNAGIIVMHVLDAGSETIHQLVKNTLGKEDWQRLQQRNQQDARNVLIGKRSAYKIVQQALPYLCSDDCAEDSDNTPDVMDFLVVEGKTKVAEQILRTVAEKECDLIVMGAHKGLSRKKLIGSVTKEVLQRSTVPVLIVPSSKTR